MTSPPILVRNPLIPVSPKPTLHTPNLTHVKSINAAILAILGFLGSVERQEMPSSAVEQALAKARARAERISGEIPEGAAASTPAVPAA